MRVRSRKKEGMRKEICWDLMEGSHEEESSMERGVEVVKSMACISSATMTKYHSQRGRGLTKT